MDTMALFTEEELSQGFSTLMASNEARVLASQFFSVRRLDENTYPNFRSGPLVLQSW